MKKIRTKVLSEREMREIAHQLVMNAGGDAVMAVVLLVGDRVSCCDEGIVLRDDPLAGTATIAPRGEWENGEPTIVGVFVRPDKRRSGIGSALFEAAIRRCLARRFKKIRVDVLTRGGKRLVEKLPAELRAHLDVHESGMLF